MGVTRLKRKGRRNKQRAAARNNRIKQLTAQPVLKNVDKEELKASFEKAEAKKAPKAKKEEAPKAEEKKEAPKAKKAAAKKEPKVEKETSEKKATKKAEHKAEDKKD